MTNENNNQSYKDDAVDEVGERFDAFSWWSLRLSWLQPWRWFGDHCDDDDCSRDYDDINTDSEC